MSNNNWLERDQSQSPGLRRIQEAQQSAALATTQEAQGARQAEMAKIEAERKRLEMIARIEQKTAQVLPLLEEIKDFANRTNTYPVAWNFFTDLKNGSPELIETAKVKVKKVGTDGFGYTEVSYAFKGDICLDIGGHHDPDTGYSPKYRSFPAACFNGIRIRVNGDTGTMELFSKREIVIPATKSIPAREIGVGLSRQMAPMILGIPEHTSKLSFWDPLPNDQRAIRRVLSDAFHDPELLDVSELHIRPEVSQREDHTLESILESAKGILHFMFG